MYEHPVGVLGRVQRGPEQGRFVELVEDRQVGCVRVYSYADHTRSGEIFDGLFFTPEGLSAYFTQARWDVDWEPAI